MRSTAFKKGLHSNNFGLEQPSTIKTFHYYGTGV